jgi:hypothetical protein
MKTMRRLTLLLASLLLLSGCSILMSEQADQTEEGFDFSEEEGFDFSDEEGMDFTDEEGMDFTDEEGMDFTDEEGMDFTDEEGMDPADDEAVDEGTQDGSVIPPLGLSTWMVKHDEGTVRCPTATVNIWGDKEESVVINTGVEGAGLEINGLDGGQTELFIQVQSVPHASQYITDFVPPGSNSTIRIEIVFSSLTGGVVADYMEGTITGEPEGCTLFRTFNGTLVN